MKKFLLTGVTGLAFVAGSALVAPALAADVIETIPTPPVAVATPFTWTGAYVGVQLGHLDAVDDRGNEFLGGDVDIDGFIGGVHAGYNFQFGSGLVLGAYADVDFSTADVDLENVANQVGELNYVARGMAKVGYGFGNALVYGQAGIAYADASIDGIDEDLDSFGYAVGVGADYAFTDSIVLGADYIYHNFSDFDSIGGLPTDQVDLDAHTVRAKFSYKF